MSDRVKKIENIRGFKFAYVPKRQELNIGIGLSFFYNIKTGLFEVDRNPHADRELVPVRDLQFSDDFSQMNFSCPYKVRWQNFEISVKSDNERLLIKFIHLAHGNYFPFFEKLYQPFLYINIDGVTDIESKSLNFSLDAIGVSDFLCITGNQSNFIQIISRPREKFPITAFDIIGDKVFLKNAKGVNEFQIVTEENIWATAKALIQNTLSHLPHISK